ncbi:MAG: hypothetical protein HKL84_03695 [Acidimicrobiaceae bacterium]|nr:hypothetical protein [Acidimicrobiaceae bacterium]
MEHKRLDQRLESVLRVIAGFHDSNGLRFDCSDIDSDVVGAYLKSSTLASPSKAPTDGCSVPPLVSIKDPCHEALSQPGRRRVKGIAPQSIFVTVLLMASNIRKIKSFRAELSCQQRPTRPKRRRTSLLEYA